MERKKNPPARTGGPRLGGDLSQAMRLAVCRVWEGRGLWDWETVREVRSAGACILPRAEEGLVLRSESARQVMIRHWWPLERKIA